ncbi:hypothetical protein SAMN02745673_02890 [Marinactinospora thermotolerans DSM 45154]|uniref:Uncharacterized protein n=1 Tax=Marinactinospora thermotolerans DSM 45154 TaxID=1122192 RepID=A0A1T4RQE0_9ACTN|nr:hypothetical protein SAMN02745673_02890 [Marinactinospora thermotolerans DSM 45154]
MSDVELTADGFDEVISGNGVVIIGLRIDRCGPGPDPPWCARRSAPRYRSRARTTVPSGRWRGSSRPRSGTPSPDGWTRTDRRDPASRLSALTAAPRDPGERSDRARSVVGPGPLPLSVDNARGHYI